MTFTSWLSNLLLTTFSNLFTQIGWILFWYWAVKTLVKEVPKWIDQYDKDKMKRLAIERAKLGLQK